MYAQQKITQAERAQRLKELAEENHTFMNMLDKYAEKFARINPDDITQIEKQVLKLVEDGKLTEAIELYNNSGLIVQARQSYSNALKPMKTLICWQNACIATPTCVHWPEERKMSRKLMTPTSGLQKYCPTDFPTS